MSPNIRDCHRIMSMSSVILFLEKAKLIILMTGTGNRNSNHTLKLQNNKLWKLPQEHEGLNPGYKNLRRIYTRLPNPGKI